MVNENLMVNARTDILEFKRKHNLLVGKGTIKTTVSNIKEMTNEDIENLSCGDVVLKEDVSGKHAYLVSFKSATGLCLTYCDASCVETQSYDKVGTNWQYNSQDLFEFKSIYYHPCYLRADNGETGENIREVRISCVIFNNSATPFTKDTFIAYIKGLMDNGALINTDGYVQSSASSYGTLVVMRKTGDNYSLLYFTPNSSMNSLLLDSYIAHTTEFVDGVNKIN